MKTWFAAYWHPVDVASVYRHLVRSLGSQP
jgi:hypothetical protein